MDQEFCKQIDDEDLIEKYIAGNLHGELLNKLTEHLTECRLHSDAVSLERALSRGVRDFARSELKTKLRFQIKKHEISKFYILRYAAILLVAIMAPIILYYQFVKVPADIQPVSEYSRPETKIQSASDDARKEPEQKLQKSAKVSERSPRAKTKIAPEPISVKSAENLASEYAGEPSFSKQAAAVPVAEDVFDLIRLKKDGIKDCIPESEMPANRQFHLQFTHKKDGSIKDILLEPRGLFSEQTTLCISKTVSQIMLPVLNEDSVVKGIIKIDKSGH